VERKDNDLSESNLEKRNPPSPEETQKIRMELWNEENRFKQASK
jgi:hypothetical protein